MLWVPLVGPAQGKAVGSKKLVLWLLVSAWVGTGGGRLEVGAGGPLYFLLLLTGTLCSHLQCLLRLRVRLGCTLGEEGKSAAPNLTEVSKSKELRHGCSWTILGDFLS